MYPMFLAITGSIGFNPHTILFPLKARVSRYVAKLRSYEKSKTIEICFDIVIISLACLLFYRIYGFDSIRWIDQCVLNYLFDDTILKRDTIFFPDLFVSKFNPYLYLHYIIKSLTTTLKLQDYQIIIKAMFFLSVVFSLWAILKISKLFFPNTLFSLSLILLYVLNINQINLGGYPLIRTTFYPGLIGMPFLLFAIYYFMKGEYTPMFLFLSVLFWIHFPTAFYLLAIFCCYLVVMREFRKCCQHYVGVVFFSVSFLMYLFVLKKLIPVSIGYTIPEWGNYLSKMMAYGHVSAYYVFSNLAIERIVFVVVNVISIIYVAYYYQYLKKEEILKKIFVSSLIVVCLYIGYCGIVDGLNLFFFIKFAFLRIGWYLAFFYIILLVYAYQIIKEKKFKIVKDGRGMVFVIILFIMATSVYMNMRYGEVLFRRSREDKGWKNVCIEANNMPEKSVFLVPYLKIDFYRYANRVSAFNRYYAGFLLSNRRMFGEMKEKYDDFIYEGFLEEYVCRVRRDPGEVQRFWWSTIAQRWVDLSEDKLMKLKEKYEITHVIREKAFPLSMPVVYENEKYTLYYVGG